MISTVFMQGSTLTVSRGPEDPRFPGGIPVNKSWGFRRDTQFSLLMKIFTKVKTNLSKD